MKKLIVGCGYLGQRVALCWLKQGADVVALTRSTGHADALRRMGIEPIVGDVMSPPSLKELPEFDTLLYAVGYDRTSGLSQYEIYVNGLKNVLTEVSRRIARLIYISSTSVYGQSSGEWIDETSPTEPTREGGKACLEAEMALWNHFPRRDRPPVANVMRLAGIYGPGRLLQRMEALKAATPLSGNPEAFLNLIHVDDAARAILACEENGLPGETYLISDDRPIYRREYFKKLAALVGAPVPVFEGQTIADAGDRGLNSRCSNRKMHDVLKVSLQFPDIDTGLAHAVASISESVV